MSLIQFNFRSKVYSAQTNVAVFIPHSAQPGVSFTSTVPKNKKFQVLYLLHGGAGNCMDYIRQTKIEIYANERKLAVVMPEVGNSFYSDMVHGPRDFTYISEELPEVMETIFPISSKRENHFVSGLSMGAQGAFKWALRRPDFFAAASGMSGVSNYGTKTKETGRSAADFGDCFGDINSFDTNVNNLEYLAKKAMQDKVDLPRLHCCIGTEDPGYKFTYDYKLMADEIKLPMTYEEGPGGHDMYFWDAWLPHVLDWFNLKNDYVDE